MSARSTPSSSVTPVLLTDRLVLRGWSDADKAPYAALNADPEVMEHFPSTLSAAQSDEMVERMRSAWSERGFGLWAVDRVDTGELIGFVGLSSPSWSERPCVEVGWRLARRHWGHGFAPEAGRVALDWGFTHLDLPSDEIVSFTTEANHKSRRVMEKLGLQHDPTRDFDHPLLASWHGRRHVLYAIDRTAWRTRMAR
jgi:ribosomal-protein-alanine N-acetyltransferase